MIKEKENYFKSEIKRLKEDLNLKESMNKSFFWLGVIHGGELILLGAILYKII